jgi:hypothetical protein
LTVVAVLQTLPILESAVVVQGTGIETTPVLVAGRFGT